MTDCHPPRNDFYWKVHDQADGAPAPASPKMLALTLAHCTFTPPPLSGMASSRRAFIGRALLGTAGATSGSLVMAPLPSFAVAPPSPQQILKSRAVYGSRVFRLQDASAAMIMDEKNVFTLFLTGVCLMWKTGPAWPASQNISANRPRLGAALSLI